FDDLVTAEVLLDTEITKELRDEGSVRDFIRRVQELRKTRGLTPRDTTSLVIETSNLGKELIMAHEKIIKKTALLDTITFAPNSGESITILGNIFKIELK
ncbi:hypothetical protein IIB50_01745, partial [Patescibacteria group bacterium]|nr:hypothetical protein [Patescibacteria group bacterium]